VVWYVISVPGNFISLSRTRAWQIIAKIEWGLIWFGSG
jgi:hypothetical protein